MAGRVQIRDPQRLEEFRAALGRFRERTLSSLRATDAGIDETARWLDERRGHWERAVVRCKQAVEEARAEYEACLSSSDDDGGRPDCSTEARALARAKEQLAAAEQALRTVRAYQQRLQEAAERYRRQASTMRQVVEGQSKRAEAALAEARSALEAYQRVSVMAGVLGVGTTLMVLKSGYASARNSVGSSAVRHARRQEKALVQATGRGTRQWGKSELRQLQRGTFPKGYYGHHVNNFARFPEQGGNPDNIRFVTFGEHLAAHQGSFRNNSSGKMLNRKSLLKQWAVKN